MISASGKRGEEDVADGLAVRGLDRRYGPAAGSVLRSGIVPYRSRAGMLSLSSPS